MGSFSQKSRLRNLSPEDFKRMYGVTSTVFKDMVKIVGGEKALQIKSGRPNKLSIEDQILVTLEYWREYRTYFHIGVSWGVDESTIFRIVRKIEKMLLRSGLFNLPGKKILTTKDARIEVVVVDVTEHGIERPKKSAPPALRFPQRKDGASTEKIL
ncbi:MAG: hypothetical protein RLZZ535_980 [Cyanobacteriota bacterium]